MRNVPIASSLHQPFRQRRLCVAAKVYLSAVLVDGLTFAADINDWHPVKTALDLPRTVVGPWHSLSLFAFIAWIALRPATNAHTR